MDEHSTLDFHFTCEEENFDSLREYFIEGINIDCQDDDGETALFNAITNQSMRIADILLSLGANPSLGNTKSDYPLHIAVEAQNMYLVKLLLWNGARSMIDERNSCGDTCLRIACKLNNDEIVQMLLNFGAKPNKSLEEKNELDMAFEQENQSLIKSLVSVTDVESLNTKNQFGEDYVELAIKLKAPELIKHLIKHGSKIDESLISKLSVDNEQDFIDSLLDMIENELEDEFIDQEDQKVYLSNLKQWIEDENTWVNGLQTLSEELIKIKGMKCEFKEKIEIVKGKVELNLSMMSLESRVEHIRDYIRIKGKPIIESESIAIKVAQPIPPKKEVPEVNNAKDQVSLDFELALKDQNIEKLTELLDSNLLQRSFKVDANTPALLYASTTNNLQLFHLLFRNKVYNNQLKELKYCWKIAKKHENQNIVAYLKILGFPDPPLAKSGKNVDPKNELFLACKLNDVEFLEEKLEEGLNLDGFYNHETLLTLAGRSGAENCLKYILANGGKVNLKNEKDETALFTAVLKESPQCVDILIAAGAKLDSWNKGLTPLMMAAAKGNSNIVFKLLTAGADKSKKTTKGISAERMAKVKGHEETVLLIERWK
ncbi:hypothetical protein A9Q84_16780 [Halobacteriovorax marinus]|uniref:Ankyrin repeat protein n=1 Tax=Halobacteriovorax marinus TaxID=97084 RepID=A0A1Y5F4I0_9BACT|nr:hypothetical protein A9Q84_16780 [Halobacteriovorax marinus]